MTQHDINFVAQFLTDNFDHFSVVSLFRNFLMLGNTIFTDLFYNRGGLNYEKKIYSVMVNNPPISAK